MSAETVNAVVVVAVAAAIIVFAVSALSVAIATWRTATTVRRVARSFDDLVSGIGTELPPTLSEMRESAHNLRRVSDELAPRLERIDALLDEGEATLGSLRATVEAAEDIVRGPAAAVDRAQRAVRAAGEGLARGADRLRHSIEERRR
jgi:hypothetical protein